MDKYEIEFEPTTHTYLINGMIVPSVTQLIHKKFPSLYANVPKSILQASAEFGNAIHKAIECDCKGLEIPKLTIQQEVTFNEYLRLKKEYNICPIESELLVHYEDKYAGCLDLIADVNYSRCLIDTKTTTSLNREYLELQLALYHRALKKMGYTQPFEKYYCLHLPKGRLGALVEIRQMKDKEVDNFLKEIGNNE